MLNSHDSAPPSGADEPAQDEARFSLRDEGDRRGSRALRWTWETSRSLALALLVVVLLRGFVVEAFKIPTGSMENTLLVGDFLIVNKAVYGAEIPGMGLQLLPPWDPLRGDVVVFHPPHDAGKHYVKRVVGIPGDTLEMRRKRLFVNGDSVAEPYVRHVDPTGDAVHPDMRWQLPFLVEDEEEPVRRRYRPSRDTWGPLVVPEDRYFVLGDSRDNSEDSRYWGFVERTSVRGQPLFVYYSFDPRAATPLSWMREIRWDRIGGRIR